MNRAGLRAALAAATVGAAVWAGDTLEDTVKTEHTPGPWRVTHQVLTDHVFTIVAPRERGGIVVGSCGRSLDDNSEMAANAKLIAAAPEMAKTLMLADELLATLDDVTVTGLRLLIDQTLRAGGLR